MSRWVGYSIIVSVWRMRDGDGLLQPAEASTLAFLLGCALRTHAKVAGAANLSPPGKATRD